MSCRLLLAAGVLWLASAPAYSQQEQVYRPGDGVSPPKVLSEVKAHYPPSAITDRIEGVVGLECVVTTEGTVREARVIRPLDPRLDSEALRTVAEWKFQPGRKDGQPVPVRVEVEIAFSLRSSGPIPQGPAIDSPEVFKPGSGVTMPGLLSEAKPMYTATAMHEGAQGIVKMKCVVLPDGTVGNVQVAQKLHPDLDDEAVRALRKWTFKPGMKDGVAVPVQVEVEMSFTLRSGPPKNQG